MIHFLRRFFPAGASVAPVQLVFLSFGLVAIVQIPSHLLVRADFISAGVLANELLAVAGVPLALIFLLRFDRSRLLPIGRPTLAAFASVVIFTLGAVIVIDYLTAASEWILPLPEKLDQAYDRLMEANGAANIVLKAVVLCLVPAICEEIYFRGFCQSSLAARFGTTKAVAITALIFAALHGNPYYVHLYFFLGLILGWVYATTGSLWAAMLTHFLNNLWTFLNHVRGFRLPMGGESNAADAELALAGAAFFAAGALMIMSASRRAAMRANQPRR